jgi:mono/diheme cytochrome c family protein
MRWIALPLVVALAAGGCGPSAEEQAAAEAAAAEAVKDSLMTAAEVGYDASVFDTVSWESPERRSEYGAVAYLRSCAKCHGPEGVGDSKFVMGGDTLRPPSFREPTWPLANDEDGIRRAIFVGTGEGMPHWGLEGLSAGAVDAMAAYIMGGLGGN